MTYVAKINGTSLPKLRGYSVTRSKLFTEAGRNMAGTLKATYIALFPKIKLEFSPTTATEMATLAGLLDNPFFTLSWYDATSQTVKSGSYYASDFETPVLDMQRELYNGFSVSLVPVAGI